MHQAQNDRPPLRPRPMSAKPSSQSSSTFSLFSSTRSLPQSQGNSGGSFTSNRRGEDGDGDEDGVDDDGDDDEGEDDEDDGGVVDDDEDSEDGESDEFGAAAQHRRQAKASMTVPSIFGASRARKAAGFQPESRQNLGNKPSKGDHRAAAAVSISYLKAAAEKKKARVREFALELLREETEYKKKISLKIDQANKMLSNAGSKKLFMLAPSSLTLWLVLREFEKLATILIGQAHHYHVHTKSSHPGARPSSAKANNGSRSGANAGAPMSKSRLNSRLTRGDVSSSTTDLIGIGADGDHRFHASSTSAATSKRTAVNATDRSQIQEELKSVLAGTIELTKALQDQLHELKLKGWNFASRANAPAAQ